MLPKQYEKLEAKALPRISRFCNGVDATSMGAFPYGATVTFRAEVPRMLGAAAVVLRMAQDGGAEMDSPLTFVSAEADGDVYEITLKTEELCSEE